MPDTYRNLPKDIDPVAHLFGDDKLTVPQSYFTPEVTVRFYERCLQEVNVKSLQNKSDRVQQGLESLPSLLRYEPGHYGTKWLRREATKEVIEPALPSKTPYQLQYLVLFGFDFPKWEDIPLVPSEDERFGNHFKVIGEVESVALLYGKNQQLYFVTARWKPELGYFGGGKEPRILEDGPYVFHLSQLTVEKVNWQDPRILERIESGQWSDVLAFKCNLYLVLEATAEVLEGRARVLRKAADMFNLDGMSIYTGR
ncbi:hypothetical protein KC902_01765 [Candidatus Kaiserbacteria bacterium]|nr:hypothetical protein [Candidatus Kaiserbacteria bacterium]